MNLIDAIAASSVPPSMRGILFDGANGTGNVYTYPVAYSPFGSPFFGIYGWIKLVLPPGAPVGNAYAIGNSTTVNTGFNMSAAPNSLGFTTWYPVAQRTASWNPAASDTGKWIFFCGYASDGFSVSARVNIDGVDVNTATTTNNSWAGNGTNPFFFGAQNAAGDNGLKGYWALGSCGMFSGSASAAQINSCRIASKASSTYALADMAGVTVVDKWEMPVGTSLPATLVNSKAPGVRDLTKGPGTTMSFVNDTIPVFRTP